MEAAEHAGVAMMTFACQLCSVASSCPSHICVSADAAAQGEGPQQQPKPRKRAAKAIAAQPDSSRDAGQAVEAVERAGESMLTWPVICAAQ